MQNSLPLKQVIWVIRVWLNCTKVGKYGHININHTVHKDAKQQQQNKKNIFVLYLLRYTALTWENESSVFANNKGADQTVHPHSLISTYRASKKCGPFLNSNNSCTNCWNILIICVAKAKWYPFSLIMFHHQMVLQQEVTLWWHHKAIMALFPVVDQITD